MRKLSFHRVVLMSMLGLVLFSCKDDDNPPAPAPTIEVLNANQTTVVVGQTLTLRYQFAAPGGIASATVSTDPGTVGEATLTQSPTVGDRSGELTVTLTGISAGSATVTLTLKDESGQAVSNQRTISVTPAARSNPPISATVVDTIASRNDLNNLASTLAAAKLLETLKGQGPFTVFAPYNAAFTNLIGTLEEVKDIDGLIATLGSDLVAVLQAHVVPGALTTQDLKAGTLLTLNDSSLTVAINGSGISVNGARLVEPDLITGNGVVHIIDSVIHLPQRSREVPPLVSTTATAADTINTREDLIGCKDAFAMARLQEMLSGPGPFTVFAPNDDAFAALLKATDNAENPSDLYDILGEEDWLALLQAHIVADSLTARDLVDGTLLTLNSEANITVTKTKEGTFVNGAKVIESDLIVTNGVVHIIDSIINLPITPVGETVHDTDALDSMAVALDALLLTDVLNDPEREYTVFAPNNQAFADFLQQNNVNSISELRAALQNGEAGGSLGELLQGHIVEGKFTANDLQAGQQLTTINGRTLTVAVTEDGFTINDIRIGTEDQVATNGVIHTISQVIPAPTQRENG